MAFILFRNGVEKKQEGRRETRERKVEQKKETGEGTGEKGGRRRERREGRQEEGEERREVEMDTRRFKPTLSLFYAYLGRLRILGATIVENPAQFPHPQ